MAHRASWLMRTGQDQVPLGKFAASMVSFSNSSNSNCSSTNIMFILSTAGSCVGRPTYVRRKKA